MPLQLHHEKLIVYQDAIAFVGRAFALVDALPSKRSVRDQLIRAAESVPLNIAVGNAGQNSAGQLQALEFASASVAEYAACIDLLSLWKCVSEENCRKEKLALISLFRRIVGLRRSRDAILREDEAEYGTPRFAHERLDCYQDSLNLAAWAFNLIDSTKLPSRTCDLLDRSSTGLILNLAEGNARQAPKDRVRFLDTSVMSALRFAATLDITVAQKLASSADTQQGKRLIAQIVNQILGLRRKEMA